MNQKWWRWVLFVLLTVLAAALEGLLLADPDKVMRLLKLR